MQFNPPCLTFDALDGLGFAAERGRLDPATVTFAADELGPVFELALLAKSKVLAWPGTASWLSVNGLAPFMEALTGRKHQWICPRSRNLGLYRTHATPPKDEHGWIEYGVAIQRAAMFAGFARAVAAQLVGAVGEMQDNIYQHSCASQTGVVAFRSCPGSFEWVVCDSGIGVLQSLRSCGEFQHMTSSGEALRLALADGVSRHGKSSGRGLGYHDLFTGLANLSGSLRFRSGDYALTIEGKDPAAIPANLRQKANLNGYLISVTCRC